MQIPEKIRIGGVDYTIEYEERLNDGVNLSILLGLWPMSP